MIFIKKSKTLSNGFLLLLIKFVLGIYVQTSVSSYTNLWNSCKKKLYEKYFYNSMLCNLCF